MAGTYAPVKTSSPVQDPFYVVKEEVVQSMTGIAALHDRWKELLVKSNTAADDEFKWCMDELRGMLAEVQSDLRDLTETTDVVENNKVKFKVDDAECKSRRKFISDTRAELRRIEADLSDTRVKGKLENDQRELLTRKKAPAAGAAPSNRFSRLEQSVQEDNDQFIEGQRTQQTQILREQDQDLDRLGHTVGNLKEISITIGNELQEQEGLIQAIDEDVDRTDRGIRGAMHKVNKLLDSTSERNQYIIILVLLLALVGLIILVIYLPGSW
eukprot:TRINITY_DN9999_c0_g1_i1.p1 TRINITY_DN9999_c0_g1~~TRINITY_DN9999_c0_g1_i1.p1  ORF type:complete len:270 (-),score=34.72 TRINITY_DN9999_c0_g1_i1:242-1051(-)